jgi:hypothetical protein
VVAGPMNQAAVRRIKGFCQENQGECGKSFFLHSMRADAATMFVWAMMAQ